MEWGENKTKGKEKSLVGRDIKTCTKQLREKQLQQGKKKRAYPSHVHERFIRAHTHRSLMPQKNVHLVLGVYSASISICCIPFQTMHPQLFFLAFCFSRLGVATLYCDKRKRTEKETTTNTREKKCNRAKKKEKRNRAWDACERVLMQCKSTSIKILHLSAFQFSLAWTEKKTCTNLSGTESHTLTRVPSRNIVLSRSQDSNHFCSTALYGKIL